MRENKFLADPPTALQILGLTDRENFRNDKSHHSMTQDESQFPTERSGLRKNTVVSLYVTTNVKFDILDLELSSFIAM